MSSFKSLVPSLSLFLYFFSSAHSASNGQFTSYIGAQFNGVKFSDVPIDPKVDFHFLLSFAIDYTTSDSPTPTNGNFNIFWDSDNLSPAAIAAIKNKNPNVKVALSIGGNSVGNIDAQFQPSSVNSWVRNAVTSLTKIIKQFNLDGIDIDYEHFNVQFPDSPDVFAQCIGQLITTLKKNGVISFASIAPFDDKDVQAHYLALWRKFGQVIDFVNFQFYAYDSSTTVAQFLKHFDDQTENYDGGKVLVSFATDGSSGGLRPETGFFSACDSLKKQGKLFGIFIWSADDSINFGGFTANKSVQLLIQCRPSKFIAFDTNCILTYLPCDLLKFWKDCGTSTYLEANSLQIKYFLFYF